MHRTVSLEPNTSYGYVSEQWTVGVQLSREGHKTQYELLPDGVQLRRLREPVALREFDQRFVQLRHERRERALLARTLLGLCGEQLRPRVQQMRLHYGITPL